MNEEVTLHDVKVIAVLRTSGERLPRTDLRVVSWNQREPVVEKRVFIADRATGLVRGGKCRGFSYQDIAYLVANWPQIQKMMKDGVPA